MTAHGLPEGVDGPDVPGAQMGFEFCESGRHSCRWALQPNSTRSTNEGQLPRDARRDWQASILRDDDVALGNPASFNDWGQFTPELRAQRVLVKSRVPEIVKYIVDNDESYLFSSITAAYDTEVKFKPFEEGAEIGYLDMDLEDAKFLINDGQHRCAAITRRLTKTPL